MKNRVIAYNQNLARAAKRISEIALNDNKRCFAISGWEKMNKVKNKNLLDLALCLTEMGKKVLVINYDKNMEAQEGTPYTVLQAFSKLKPYTYSTKYGEYDAEGKYDIVLMNLLPADSQMAFLENERFFDYLLLSFQYGALKYEDMDNVMEFIKGNQINLLGLLANK